MPPSPRGRAGGALQLGGSVQRQCPRCDPGGWEGGDRDETFQPLASNLIKQQGEERGEERDLTPLQLGKHGCFMCILVCL